MHHIYLHNNWAHKSHIDSCKSWYDSFLLLRFSLFSRRIWKRTHAYCKINTACLKIKYHPISQFIWVQWLKNQNEHISFCVWYILAWCTLFWDTLYFLKGKCMFTIKLCLCCSQNMVNILFVSTGMLLESVLISRNAPEGQTMMCDTVWRGEEIKTICHVTFLEN